MEDMATILESAFEPAKTLPNVVAEDDDWTAALEQLEAKLSKEQNIVTTSPQPKPSSQVSELSADEFFASLEFEKLNDFADNVDKSRSAGQGLAAIADIADIGSTDGNDLDADDLLLKRLVPRLERLHNLGLELRFAIPGDFDFNIPLARVQGFLGIPVPGVSPATLGLLMLGIAQMMLHLGL